MVPKARIEYIKNNKEEEIEKSLASLNMTRSDERKKCPVQIKKPFIPPKIDTDLANEEHNSTGASSLTNSNQNVKELQNKSKTPFYKLNGDVFTFSPEDFKEGRKIEKTEINFNEDSFKDDTEYIKKENKNNHRRNHKAKDKNYSMEQIICNSSRKNHLPSYKRNQRNEKSQKEIQAENLFRKPSMDSECNKVKNQFKMGTHRSGEAMEKREKYKILKPDIMSYPSTTREKSKKKIEFRTDENYLNKNNFYIPQNEYEIPHRRENTCFNTPLPNNYLNNEAVKRRQRGHSAAPKNKINIQKERIKEKEYPREQQTNQPNQTKHHKNSRPNSARHSLNPNRIHFPKVNYFNQVEDEFSHLVNLASDKYYNDPEIQNMLGALVVNIKQVKKAIQKKTKKKPPKEEETQNQPQGFQYTFKGGNLTFGENAFKNEMYPNEGGC